MENATDAEVLTKLVRDCHCIEMLSVIFKAPQPSIERIVAGEAMPTESFSKQIREVAAFYYSNGMSWKKLCKHYLDNAKCPNFYPLVCSSSLWWIWAKYFFYFSLAGIFVYGLSVLFKGGIGEFVCDFIIVVLFTVYTIGGYPIFIAHYNARKLSKHCDYQLETAVEKPIISSDDSNLANTYYCK